MNRPPKMAPEMEANPPTTTPTRKVMERKSVKLSGATNCTTIAESAPATPWGLPLDPEQMAGTVDEKLYRNRG